MHKYIIMGVQGSGKGTQAKLLAERLDLEHISVGDIFRWNVQHHTKLGAQVRRSVAAGDPYPTTPSGGPQRSRCLQTRPTPIQTWCRREAAICASTVARSCNSLAGSPVLPPVKTETIRR